MKEKVQSLSEIRMVEKTERQDRRKSLDLGIEQNKAPKYEYDSARCNYQPKIENPDDDPEEHFIALMQSLGTANIELSRMFINQLVAVLKWDKDEILNAALAFLYEQKPRDGIEALLSIQMFCAHQLVMICAARAAMPAASELMERSVNMTTKMMRNFTTQVECLAKHRGNGGQKITVEHVTVNQGQGGKTIVAVNQPIGGRGLGNRNGIETGDE